MVLYEALCARPPFDADTPAATALARLHQVPARPRHLRATVPMALDAVVMRCLEIEPDQRYHDASALRAALIEARDHPDGVDDTATTRIDPTATWTGAAVAAAPGPVPADALRAAPAESATHATWLRPVLITAFVVGALALAGVLVGRTPAGQGLFDWAQRTTSSTVPATRARPATIPIRQVSSFDPGGRGTPGENDDLLPHLIDGNTSTAWVTDSYDQRDFGFKPGVGVVLTLDRSTTLDQLEVTSPTHDWAASVYLADAPGSTLADWGAPVAQQTGINGDLTVDLQGHQGRDVLIWITDLGDGPPRVHTEIDEVTLRGRG